MPQVDKAVFGRRLEARRRYKGMSRARDLADAVTASGIYMSKRTVYAVEEGDQYPSVPQLLALLDVLGVGLDYFLEDES